MKFTEDNTMRISIGAVTITLFSTLVGGHLIASYFLYKPDFWVLTIFMKVVAAVLILNIIYFAICCILLLACVPKKALVLKTALLMLINIPLAIGCLILVLTNEI